MGRFCRLVGRVILKRAGSQRISVIGEGAGERAVVNFNDKWLFLVHYSALSQKCLQRKEAFSCPYDEVQKCLNVIEAFDPRTPMHQNAYTADRYHRPAQTRNTK